MKHRGWVLGLPLLFCGCMFSRGFAYYSPSGAGKTVVDDHRIPSTMEYRFATGSMLLVSTTRKRAEVAITLTVRLRGAARFTSESAGILFLCDGRTIPMPEPIWHERRVKDGVAYLVDHAWGDDLGARNAPPPASKPARGDYSLGEYRALMILRECKDLPFSFTLPKVTFGESVHEFGRVYMTPQMMPVTWTLPVPSRVEDGLK